MRRERFLQASAIWLLQTGVKQQHIATNKGLFLKIVIGLLDLDWLKGRPITFWLRCCAHHTVFANLQQNREVPKAHTQLFAVKKKVQKINKWMRKNTIIHYWLEVKDASPGSSFLWALFQLETRNKFRVFNKCIYTTFQGRMTLWIHRSWLEVAIFFFSFF